MPPPISHPAHPSTLLHPVETAAALCAAELNSTKCEQRVLGKANMRVAWEMMDFHYPHTATIFGLLH